MAVDLHTHSCCSDGSLTPSELMELAYEKKLSAIALTDHDTVSGIKEAKKAAEDLSITLIPGIEISSLYDLGNVVKEFHILGLGVDETVFKKVGAIWCASSRKKRENAASNQRKRLQY